jgi:hypothetical protein
MHNDAFRVIRGRVGRARIHKVGGILFTSALATGVIASAAGTGVASAFATAGGTAPAVSLALVTGAPQLNKLGDSVVGAVSNSTRENGLVALRPRSQSAVTNFIAEMNDKRSPLYHHYLEPGQYADRFGPTPAEVAAVREQLASHGLKVSVSSNRLLVSFSGTAAQVESTFHTGLETVRLSQGGIGQATTSAVRLPSTISNDVQAVIGLNQLVKETDPMLAEHGAGRRTPGVSDKPAQTTAGPSACAGALALTATGAIPDDQLAEAYGLDPLFNEDDTGEGQTIDVYELEPFLQSDLTAFDDCYFPNGRPGGTTATVTQVDNGAGTGPGSGEAALDVDTVSAIAPGATIHVFEGPNMNSEVGPTDVWNAIAETDDASQISSSWGLCEVALQVGAPGIQQVEEDIFEQTAAQGQSVFQAAGDDGSDGCAYHSSTPAPPDLSVIDPGSPYVTQVGGTTILDASTPPVETVWNNGADGGGGGGGISETWPEPSWQAGIAVNQTSDDEYCSDYPSSTLSSSPVPIGNLAGDYTTLPAGTSCREMPDVSALADPQTGYTIFLAGFWYQYGGTSAATPLWAAVTAVMNSYIETSCAGATSAGVGFINPELYQVGSGPDYADAFNDVTSGNNDNLQVGTGLAGFPFYQAGTGYDMASGLGTPQVATTGNGLVFQLCAIVGSADTTPPTISSIAPDDGNVSGSSSTPVTITGSNFGPTAGSVHFGDQQVPPADITTWTSSSIVLSGFPAYYDTEGSPSTYAGNEDVAVTLPGTPVVSSEPGAESVFHYTTGPTDSDPDVDYVAAAAGSPTGGNTAYIVGNNFEATGAGTLSVTFGGVPATSVTAVSDTELSVTVPQESDSTDCLNASADAGSVCQVEVVVSDTIGSSTPGDILPTYQGPVVFEPNGALVVPPDCGCEIDQAPGEYDYAPAPTVSSISPAYASETGGTTLTLTGTGFNLLTFEWVNIGDSSFTNTNQDFNLDGITPTQLVVTAPEDPNYVGMGPTTEPDPSALSVQTYGGVSTSNPSFAFAGVPTVSGISCTGAGEKSSPGGCVGAQSAQNEITITGSGFDDADQITVSGQFPRSYLQSTTTNFTVVSDTEITATLPQFFSLPTDVLVCSLTGCSTPDPAVDTFIFAYPGQPVVTSSSPPSGGEQGGATVTIQGKLDSLVLAVLFGTTPATIESEPEMTASGPITVVSPPVKSAGTVDIRIETIGGYLVGETESAPNTSATFTFSKSAPSAPQNLKVKAGNDSLTASWAAPVTNGGYSITGYEAVASANGQKSVTVKTTKLTATLTGLKHGVAYTVTVYAINKLGKGLPATSAPIKPTS